MKRKNVVFCIIVTLLASISCFSNDVKADNDNGAREIGIECVGNYSTWSDLNNLNSPIDIANDFEKAFKNKPKKWNVKFKFLDNIVEELDFKGASLGGNDDLFADNVDLLIYSGHGVMPKKHGAKDYSFALNTKNEKKYAQQKEMYLGNRDLEWLVTFTCNFLQSKDLDRIGHLAKGIHAVCGFETVVVLTPNMGSVFARKLKSGYSIKESFFATAKETSTWYNGGTAGVFTTKSNANDKLGGYGGAAAGDPKSYSKDKKGYVLYSYKY